MKNKSTKRSISYKQRAYPNHSRRLSSSNDQPHGTISPNKIDLGTGTVHLDSHTCCLKPNVLLKSQKLLKRDLLRCSNQRPSLLGPQTLQPPRVHHGSQQVHSVISASSSTSSKSSHQNTQHRRSLSVHSHTFHSTIDRIGPWPDISINRLCSNGNDLLRPLKNFRSVKNPRLFSPKYYAGLNDTTSKFKFYPSNRTYMDEYRKQKGYLLNTRSQPTSLSFSSSTAPLEEDQLSIIGTFSGGAGNDTRRDRTDFSMTTLSLSTTRAITRSTNDMPNSTRSPVTSSVSSDVKFLPSIPSRNHPHHSRRVIRQTVQQQTIALPAITTSSIHYLNSMSSVEKTYTDNTKSSPNNASKLYVLDGRQTKRETLRPNSTSEVTSRPQDHVELRTACSSVMTQAEQPAVVVMYQLPRRTQNNIESLS